MKKSESENAGDRKPVPTTPAERRAEAVRLRVAGLGVHAIASRLGVSPKQAMQLIRHGLAEALGFSSEEYRIFHVIRCEHLINKYMGVACRGDTAAAKTVALLQSHQAKLLGIDQPTTGTMGGEIKVTIVRPDGRPDSRQD